MYALLSLFALFSRRFLRLKGRSHRRTRDEFHIGKTRRGNVGKGGKTMRKHAVSFIFACDANCNGERDDSMGKRSFDVFFGYNILEKYF